MPDVRVNGERRTVTADTSLAALVRETVGDRELDGVAAALNREIVPRSEWKQTRIEEDDDIEIIAPFQGG